MKNSVFERARTFMYRNARPLDMARFQYHFEGGRKETVMRALSYYQNEDGGFGHALEADCWNPNSIPLHSNAAGSIISEIDYEDAGHPVIQRLLSWYADGKCFNGKSWDIVVRSNNDYPHAPWWHTESESSCHTDYNGTAQIAGFLIHYGKVGSEPYQLGVRIANEAIEAFVSSEITDMHTCACYVHMLEHIIRAGAEDQVPCKLLKELLHTSVNGLITTDRSKWGGYVCRPSRFMNSRDSAFYPANKEIAEYECEYIADTQLPDGSWDIPWGWEAFPEEWAISKNWWKGQVIIENLIYLKGFGVIDRKSELTYLGE